MQVAALSLAAALATVLAAPAQRTRADRPQVDPCGAIVTFATGQRPVRELHVSPDGNDATGTGSRVRPYATIAFAARRATPGTAVLMHAGVYGGGQWVADVRGTASAPIWIGSAGDGAAVIDGGGEGLHLVRPRYLIVHGLEIRNASQNGLNCDDGSETANPEAARFVLFRNLFIHDIGGTGNQDGLKLSGLNDFAVLDCRIERCGGGTSGSGIDCVGCHRGLIARSRLADTSGNAVQCKGGSEDVEIRWCRLENPGPRGVNIGGSTGFAYFRPPLSSSSPNREARNIRVLANEIVGGDAAVAFVGATDCLVAHNTIIAPQRWVLRILQETTTSGSTVFLPCADNTFSSNLVWFEAGVLSRHVNIGPNTLPATFVFSNNLWFAFDAPSSSQPALPGEETGAVIGRDPALVDPARGNYAIRADSPAVRAARVPVPISADIRGACYQAPPSIGAHEGAR